MTITFVSGDPLLTQAQALAFGHNARGRTELGRLETLLLNRYAAAFSIYRKQCRQGRVQPGTFWLWRESQPRLAFMVVRESSVSPTRLRHVQAAVLRLARDYFLEGITSLAIAPLGSPSEWPECRPILTQWLEPVALPVVVYERYLPDVRADEALG